MGTFYSPKDRYHLAHYGRKGMRWGRHLPSVLSEMNQSQYASRQQQRGQEHNQMINDIQNKRKDVYARAHQEYQDNIRKSNIETAAQNRQNAMKIDTGNGRGVISSNYGTRTDRGTRFEGLRPRRGQAVTVVGSRNIETTRPRAELVNRNSSAPSARQRIINRRASEAEYAARQNPNNQKPVQSKPLSTDITKNTNGQNKRPIMKQHTKPDAKLQTVKNGSKNNNNNNYKNESDTAEYRAELARREYNSGHANGNFTKDEVARDRDHIRETRRIYNLRDHIKDPRIANGPSRTGYWTSVNHPSQYKPDVEPANPNRRTPIRRNISSAIRKNKRK